MSTNTDKNMLNESENILNTSFLAFSQTALRLRHLTQIIGYNLTSFSDSKSFYSNPLPSSLPRPLPKNGYYFTLESSLSSDLEYTSQLLPSNHPNWDSFDCGQIFPVHMRSLKGIIIRVYMKRENEDKVPITSWGINFSGLVPVSLKHDFLPNTLLLKLRGQFYTSYDNLKTDLDSSSKPLFKLHQGFSLALSETKPSCTVSSLCRFHSNKRLQRQLERRRESLKDSLDSQGFNIESKRMVLQNQIEDVKIRICVLMEELEAEMNLLRSIKLAADNLDCNNQDKGLELLEGFQGLNRFLSTLRTDEARLGLQHECLEEVADRVKERRLQLFSQLPLVFPIRKSMEDGLRYWICGVELPDAENYDGHSEQALSVALGFVAQLVWRIAFLVGLPLKYPLTLRGSQSSVADLTSTQLLDVETQFPLYTRGKEKERLHFHYGVFLLNKNIAQLRFTCGLRTSDLRPTLHNVWSLLCSLQDESWPPPHASMPDICVTPLVLPASLRHTVATPIALLHHQHQAPRAPLASAPLHSRSLGSLAGPSSPPRNGLRPLKGKPPRDTDSYPSSDADSGLDRPDSSEGDTQRAGLPLAPSRHAPGPLHLTSYSLDHGLNFIEGEVRNQGGTRRREQSAPQFARIPGSSSGSFPNLASSKGSLEEGGACVPLGFHAQTTQMLESWHQDDPSPYASIVTGSSSSERLEGATEEAPLYPGTASSEGGSDATFKHSRDAESESQMKVPCQKGSFVDATEVGREADEKGGTGVSISEEERDEKNKVSPKEESRETPEERTPSPTEEEAKSPSKQEDEEVESLQTRLAKEMGLSLSDIGIDEDPLLTDVSSRTANLASHNCSFKLSFSRQSTQE